MTSSENEGILKQEEKMEHALGKINRYFILRHQAVSKQRHQILLHYHSTWPEDIMDWVVIVKQTVSVPQWKAFHILTGYIYDVIR